MDTEVLNYIKNTGNEIQRLNDRIEQKNQEIRALTEKIGNLDKLIDKQNNTIDELSMLYNETYWKHSNLVSDYRLLEAQFNCVSTSLGLVAPKLKDQLDMDFEDGLLSDWIREFKMSGL